MHTLHSGFLVQFMKAFAVRKNNQSSLGYIRLWIFSLLTTVFLVKVVNTNLALVILIVTGDCKVLFWD